ncbi:MAG: hypothetical protein U0694_05955 [Anaerolineae bacterium]
MTAAQRLGQVGAHFYEEQISAVVDGTLVEPDARQPHRFWIGFTAPRLIVSLRRL